MYFYRLQIKWDYEKKFFFCCLFICYHGNMFTQLLPGKGKGLWWNAQTARWSHRPPPLFQIKECRLKMALVCITCQTALWLLLHSIINGIVGDPWISPWYNVLISASCLLTGFIQTGFQCWENIWLSTWTQGDGICGCAVFSSVFLLASTKQNNSWLLQSWCRGQWTWCSEDYTIWKVRYSGKFYLFII
jgi:hypothetical protein